MTIVVTNMEFNIRKMSEKDIDAVKYIEDKSFMNPWSYRSFRLEIEDDSYSVYLSAVNDEKVIGYGGGWIIIDELHITNLAVAEEFRRQGVGEKIINELEKTGLNRGIYRATLEVRKSNIAAIKLYKKLGYVQKGVRENYYQSDNEDALIMCKYFKKAGDC